jgi:glycosyltransferase involved in cell wall biosynthesis
MVLDGKVSIIIPMYNEENYIEQCIFSCLKQAEVGQVIIIDDCSTDGSIEIVNKVKNTKVYLIRNEINKGPGYSRNIGLNFVKCEYFTFLDADDHYLLNRFHRPLLILNSNINLDGTYESVKNYFQSGFEKFRNDTEDVIEIASTINSDRLFDYLILDYLPLFTITSLVLRSKTVLKTRFDITFRQAEDIDYIYQIGQKFKLEKIIQSEIKIMRRLHPKSITAFSSDEAKVLRYKLLEKWVRKILVSNFTSKQNRWLIYRWICIDYVKISGSKHFFIRVFLKSALYLRFLILNPSYITKIV